MNEPYRSLTDVLAAVARMCAEYKAPAVDSIICHLCGRTVMPTRGSRTGLYYIGSLAPSSCPHCGPIARFDKYEEAVKFLTERRELTANTMASELNPLEPHDGEEIPASEYAGAGREAPSTDVNEPSPFTE